MLRLPNSTLNLLYSSGLAASISTPAAAAKLASVAALAFKSFSSHSLRLVDGCGRIRNCKNRLVVFTRKLPLGVRAGLSKVFWLNCLTA